MASRNLLIGSLALNVLLGIGWWLSRNGQPGVSVESAAAQPGIQESVRTNVVVRRQFFSWEELESEDYATYIANLRSINCPEETIRDIIIADIDALFAKRRNREVLPTAQQWWQSEPDPTLLRTASRQLQALEAERNRLLTELLGPDWATPPEPLPTVAIKVPLEGAILSSLPVETQEAIQEISGRTQRQFEQLLELSGTGEPDPAALAVLEQQLRQELAPLLTPSQLQEFLLRYSPSAHRLRAELSNIALFNASDSELRSLFRAVESIDLQLMSLIGKGAAAEAQREALLRDREIAFRNALGPSRYREYERLQDPTYQDAVAAAQAAGVTRAADLFYAIDQVGAQQAAEIRADTNLTPLQQEMALRKLELEQLQAAGAVLGEPPLPEPPPPPPRTYSFREGDTIAEVSMRTGIPVALILQANPGLQADRIPAGTRIIIPEPAAPAQ
jgi:hypothetical protein